MALQNTDNFVIGRGDEVYKIEYSGLKQSLNLEVVNLWERNGNTLSPVNSGDDLADVGGATFGSSVTAPTFIGALDGNAATATTAVTADNATTADNAANANNAANADKIAVTADDSTAAERFVNFTSSQSGDESLLSDSNLTYNPSTNTLTVGAVGATTYDLDALPSLQP